MLNRENITLGLNRTQSWGCSQKGFDSNQEMIPQEIGSRLPLIKRALIGRLVLITVINSCVCIRDLRDVCMSAPEKNGMVQAAKTAEVPEGTMKGVIVAGKQVLIAHVGERFYAVDAICSHMSGYLPAGTLRGNLVTCPIHEAEFDVRSGKVIKNVSQVIRLASHGKAKDLQVYEVKVVGDDVLVKVS